MSDCKANNMTSHSVVDEVSDSGNLYAVPDKSTPNPAYRYFTCNKTEAKTGNPERPYLNEQPGSVSSQHVRKNEDSVKANALALKNVFIRPTYLIALLVAVALLIAAGIAFIVAFVEISKLQSEVAILQSTSPKQAMSIQALENSIDMRLNDIGVKLNKTELNLQLNWTNISNSIFTHKIDIGQLNSQLNDQLSSEINNNTQVTEVLAPILDIGVFLLPVLLFSIYFLSNPPQVTFRSGPPMALLLLHTVI